LVSRVVAQYFIDRGQPFLGFDTDRSHSTLLRFYADFASPIVVDQYEGLDQIVEAACENRERRILVDLAAQTHAPLIRWMDDSGVLEMAGEAGLTHERGRSKLRLGRCRRVRLAYVCCGWSLFWGVFSAQRR
jgi:hypothetical protein